MIDTDFVFMQERAGEQHLFLQGDSIFLCRQMEDGAFQQEVGLFVTRESTTEIPSGCQFLYERQHGWDPYAVVDLLRTG